MSVTYRIVLAVKFKGVREPRKTGGMLRDQLEKALGEALISEEFEHGETLLESLQGQVFLLKDDAEELIKMRVVETDLSRKAKTFLTKTLNIQNVKQMARISRARLQQYVKGPKSVRNFGQGTADEIWSWMLKHQLVEA